MAITQHYSLFVDCPAVFDPTAMFRGKPVLNYDSQYGARIGVLPRHAAGTNIRWFEIETCFVFHLFNAYEDGDEVVLYGCRYAKYPEFVEFGGPGKSSDSEATLKAFTPIAHVWRMNMKTGHVAERAIDELTSEFPRVNERLTGTKTKYGYAVSSTTGSASFLRYDFEQGTRQKHSLGNGYVAGDGVFVPRPSPKSEEDGWLVSLTHDRAEGTSELRVVDCCDLSGDPVARVRIPQRVPYGFHAIWVENDVL